MDDQKQKDREFEFFKHLTTLCSGGLIVYATVAEKIKGFENFRTDHHFVVIVGLGLSLILNVHCLRKTTFLVKNEKPASDITKAAAAILFCAAFFAAGVLLWASNEIAARNAAHQQPAEAR